MKITMKKYNVVLIGYDSLHDRRAYDILATDEHGAIREAIVYWTEASGRHGFELEAGMEFEVTEL